MSTAWIVYGQKHIDIKTAMLKNVTYLQLPYCNKVFTDNQLYWYYWLKEFPEVLFSPPADERIL
jgi:hypothetical protein